MIKLYYDKENFPLHFRGTILYTIQFLSNKARMCCISANLLQ